jgi:hypothetical protein
VSENQTNWEIKLQNVLQQIDKLTNKVYKMSDRTEHADKLRNKA